MDSSASFQSEASGQSEQTDDAQAEQFQSGKIKNKSVNEQLYAQRRQEEDYNLCEILGIQPETFFADDISPEERVALAKKHFRERAKQFHPDAHVGASPEDQKKLADEFKELTTAYELLGNPDIIELEREYFATEEVLRRKREERAQNTTTYPHADTTASSYTDTEETIDEITQERRHDSTFFRGMTPEETEAYLQELSQLFTPTVDYSGAVNNYKYFDAFRHMYTDAPRWQTTATGERSAFSDQEQVRSTAETRKQTADELRRLTEELHKEHDMPRGMFNMYMRAVAELAKAVAESGNSLSSEDIRASLEYKLVERYQRLLDGRLTLREVLNNFPLEFFELDTENYLTAQITDRYSLRDFSRMKDEEFDRLLKQFDDELSLKIRIQTGASSLRKFPRV